MLGKEAASREGGGSAQSEGGIEGRQKNLLALREKFGLAGVIFALHDGRSDSSRELAFVCACQSGEKSQVAEDMGAVLPSLMDACRGHILPFDITTRMEMQMLREICAARMNCLAIPLHAPRGLFATLLALHEAAYPIDDFLAELHLASVRYFETFIRGLESRDGESTDGLTQRERECLFWCTKGKSYWETSRILGISERTVSHHMSQVRNKLGVMSNAQAVALASQERLFAHGLPAHEKAGK